MTYLLTHRPTIQPDASDGDTTRAGTSIECDKAPPSSLANLAIVVSKMTAMGVNVSFKPASVASESPASNDGAQPGLPQPVRRRRYEAHIGSIAWKAGGARLGELKASEFRCRTCNASAEEAELQVHHRTYERFGRELQGDLTTLCADCHVVVTDMLRRRRYAVFTPASADVAATDRRAPLFDPMAPGEWS
jgi:hypothetical protein